MEEKWFSIIVCLSVAAFFLFFGFMVYQTEQTKRECYKAKQVQPAIDCQR